MSVFLQDPDVTLHHGDVLDVLREMEAESVDCAATSPPFYGLRDYGVDGQIGLESSPSCGQQGLMRLRSDLTEAQREFVARRLLGLDVPDA